MAFSGGGELNRETTSEVLHIYERLPQSADNHGFAIHNAMGWLLRFSAIAMKLRLVMPRRSPTLMVDRAARGQ